MKLETKIFNSFFYPFLSSVILSSLIVTIIIIFFINNIDERTSENIINLEKNYSKIIINQINTFITTKFQLYQNGLNEIILMYQKAANELLESTQNMELDNTFLKCLLSIEEEYCDEEEEKIENLAFWLLDDVT